jgi:Ca2+ transporting ATPase
VTVLRNGSPESIDSKELVVGDILLFNLGDMFGVDGAIISGSEVRIDESAVTGESNEIKKIPFEEIKHGSKQKNQNFLEEKFCVVNPLLISGTKVVDGSGQMLVLAVGDNTCQG